MLHTDQFCFLCRESDYYCNGEECTLKVKSDNEPASSPPWGSSSCTVDLSGVGHAQATSAGHCLSNHAELVPHSLTHTHPHVFAEGVMWYRPSWADDTCLSSSPSDQVRSLQFCNLPVGRKHYFS